MMRQETRDILGMRTARGNFFTIRNLVITVAFGFPAVAIVILALFNLIG